MLQPSFRQQAVLTALHATYKRAAGLGVKKFRIETVALLRG
jgi:hypothetical protein